MLDFLLVFSLPKLVFDDEMCGQALRFVREIQPVDDLPVGAARSTSCMADQHLIMAEHTMAHWPTSCTCRRRSSTATTARTGRSSARRTRTSARATRSTGGWRRTGSRRPIRGSTRSSGGSSVSGLVSQTELPVIPPAPEPTAEALAATAGPARRRNLRRGG